MAKEFMHSREVIVLITVSQLAIILITLMRMQDGLLTIPTYTVFKLVCVTLLVQLCARVALCTCGDQLFAARVFGVVSAMVTFSQWLVVIHVERTTGYSIIDAYVVDAASPSHAFFLVVGLLHTFLQGLICALSHAYCALRVILLGSLLHCFCGLYLYLHVQSPGPTLLTEIEFFGIFTAIVLSCVVLSLAQLHSRRVHVAQIACLAEELAKQRDRLQYDLSFAEKLAADSLPKRGALSSASALSSAVGELDAALERAGSCCGDSWTEDPPELYPLRPQYFHEVRGDGVTHLLTDDERACYELTASNGFLVDCSGTKVAQASVQSGIYVLSSCGRLYANFDPDPAAHAFYHSSFVAGREVAAAGAMTVRDGLLLSLSNESGHYIPAPSSLSTILRRLTKMGVSNLTSVRLEIVHSTAYDVPAMVTAGPTTARSRRTITSAD